MLPQPEPVENDVTPLSTSRLYDRKTRPSRLVDAFEGRGESGPELCRVRLPVSRRLIAVQPPSGLEDLLIAESNVTPAGDASLALALATRLGSPVDGQAMDWEGMSVTDITILIISLRQALVGDRVRSDTECLEPDCGDRIDISFHLTDYLNYHAPRPPHGRGFQVERLEEPGWFRLMASRVEFRLPTIADQIALSGQPGADRELASRCLRPTDVPSKLRRRAEAAMAMMAPSLVSDLEGVCPGCGRGVTISFDARWYCLRELRDRAAFIYEEVDLLARRYHWPETDILAMPHARRAAYADLARRD